MKTMFILEKSTLGQFSTSGKLPGTIRLHTNIYSSFMHNRQKPEVTKMSFIRWMYKERGYKYIVKYYSVRKETTKPRRDMDNYNIMTLVWL